MRSIKLHDANHHVHVVSLSSCQACGSESMIDATSKAVIVGCQSCAERVTVRAKKSTSHFDTAMAAVIAWNAKQPNCKVSK